MRIFKEEQKFTQIWLQALLIVSFVPVLIIIVRDWMQSANHDVDSNLGLLTGIGSILLVYALIYSLKLKTRIDEKGIYYRFIPFHLSVKFIPWDELNSAFVRKYKPISEYGGWGIKGGKLWNKSNGVAFNVKGNIGLQLKLVNGKRILIGTQQEKEIKRVLMTYADKITNHEN